MVAYIFQKENFSRVFFRLSLSLSSRLRTEQSDFVIIKQHASGGSRSNKNKVK